jgi:hypothetical protein
MQASLSGSTVLENTEVPYDPSDCPSNNATGKISSSPSNGASGKNSSYLSNSASYKVYCIFLSFSNKRFSFFTCFALAVPTSETLIQALAWLNIQNHVTSSHQ